jgi:Zn-dependent peptidase ImmA (M78 family)
MGALVMSYQSLYKDLARAMKDWDVEVCDHDFYGYCAQIKNVKGVIFIKSSLSYKERYFVLCHEVGHLFYMKKDKPFNWSKKPRTEDQANWFAMQLLKNNGVDVEEYKQFYNKALLAAKKRKKSWFEL